MQDDLEATHVGRAHFERALGMVRPRISAEMMAFYRRMQASL